MLHRCGSPLAPLLLILLATALATGPILGQPDAPAAAEPPDAQPRDGEVFIDTVQVRVVDVDVYVSDRRGNPVTGLGPEDFEIREDGRPMEVTNFFEVRERRVVAPPPASGEATGDEPEQAAPDPSHEPLPEDQRLHLVLLIDNVNIRPLNRNRVLREVREFVREHVPPGSEILVASYDRRLRLRHGPTRELDGVLRHLVELETHAGQAVHVDSDRRDTVRMIHDARSAGEAMGWANQYAENLHHELEMTVTAMRELVRNLAGVPGRKAVVYVSDGLPMIPGEDLFYMIEARFGESRAITQGLTFNALRRFQELAAQANAERVTFYTIDARGLTTFGAAGAEVAPGDDLLRLNHVDSIHNLNLQAPLQLIARSTGGRAVLNANRALPDLERIAQDFGNYYSLGYRPRTTGTGRYRRIDVRVARPGVTVRHREGYRDKSPEALMNDVTLAALHLPREHNPLGIRLAIGRDHTAEGEHFRVPVQLGIPLDGVTLLPRGEGFEGRLRIWLAAIDEHGGESGLQEIPLPVRLASAAELEANRARALGVPVTLTLRDGPHRLAVVVRDELGDQYSVLTRQLVVAAGGGP